MTIWTVFNPEREVFDRIVLRNWWVYREEVFVVGCGGHRQARWRVVPLFRKKSPAKTDPSKEVKND